MRARVTCWRDKHGADGFESEAELTAAPPPQSQAALAARSNTPGTIAALDLALGSRSSSAKVVDHQHNGSSSRSLADAVHGFMLCCKSRCDSVVTEFTNRKTKAQPYEEVRHRFLAAYSIDNPGRQQQQQHSVAFDTLCSNASTASSSRSGGSRRSIESSLPPLPDVAQSPTIELIHFITLSDMRPIFTTPVYRQLDLSPWIRSSQHTLGGTAGVAAGSDSPEDVNMLTGSALQLTGLWRGTYGSHGVELLQLQLLQAPPGYDMFQVSSNRNTLQGDAAPAGADDIGSGPATVAAALAADNASDGTPGVLLKGVAGMTDARSSADIPTLYAELPMEAAAAAAGPPGESLVVVYDNPAVAAGDAAQQQQQQDEGPDTAAAASSSQRQQQTPQQLLLVATKLTGDMNVPVGHVSFAVDVGSHVPGGNELLQLSGTTDTDVSIHAAGTRQLRIKVSVLVLRLTLMSVTAQLTSQRAAR